MFLQTVDFDQLSKQFYIHRNDKEQIVISVPAIELLEQAKMDHLIDTYAPLMKALERKAAAAYFCSWFGATALALQYGVSYCNKLFDLSLHNITVQLYCKDDYYWYSFKIHSWSEEDGPTETAERTEWLRKGYDDFYGNTLRPIFETAARSGGIDVGQMWGQLPTRFNYSLAIWMEEESDPSLRERIDADYRLLKEIDPAAFARSKNPLNVKIRRIEHLEDPSKQMRMKNVCCLYYLTEGGHLCYTCPKLKEEDRAARREQHRAKQVSSASVKK